MFQQLAGLSLHLEHRHSDGSWSELERTHHDPADHDQERAWANGEVYRCKTCDEQVRISTVDQKPIIGPAGTE
jgi:hypothetical protein